MWYPFITLRWKCGSSARPRCSSSRPLPWGDVCLKMTRIIAKWRWKPTSTKCVHTAFHLEEFLTLLRLLHAIAFLCRFPWRRSSVLHITAWIAPHRHPVFLACAIWRGWRGSSWTTSCIFQTERVIDIGILLGACHSGSGTWRNILWRLIAWGIFSLLF